MTENKFCSKSLFHQEVIFLEELFIFKVIFLEVRGTESIIIPIGL